MSKIGRNEPCPCGSGKKYKKCCLEKTESGPGKEKSIRSALIQDILAFAREFYGVAIVEALQYYWSDFDPQAELEGTTAAMADINFWEWFVHDWRPEEDEKKTVIELYAERKARRLREEERAILVKMNDAVLSLFEVREVFPEQGLLLEDLLLGGQYNVMEKAATRTLRRWDIFAARILRIDGNHIMTGSVYPYPVTAKEETIDHLKQCLRDFRKDHPLSTMRDFLKQNGDLFNYYWCEHMGPSTMPTLMTTTGEPLVISSATFDVKNKATAMRELKQMDELVEAEKGVYHWLDSQPDSDDSTILGTIRIEGSTLFLECNSKGRIEKGKVLLLDRLDASIHHKNDTFQDPYQVLKNPTKTPEKTKDDVPKALEQEMYTRYMRKHYESWVNEQLPVLKGQTPLETIRKPWGKKKVAELLKTIENMEEHKRRKGEPYFDISWLWDRLGIDR